MGPPGPPGPAGSAGLQGPPGIKGDRGHDGAKGDPVSNYKVFDNKFLFFLQLTFLTRKKMTNS